MWSVSVYYFISECWALFTTFSKGVGLYLLLYLWVLVSIYYFIDGCWSLFITWSMGDGLYLLLDLWVMVSIYYFISGCWSLFTTLSLVVGLYLLLYLWVLNSWGAVGAQVPSWPSTPTDCSYRYTVHTGIPVHC